MSDYTPYDAYTMRECIERQDSTIARLEAEIAARRAELADLKDGLTAAHMDGFASGKAEATEMLRKREGQLEELRAEVEQLKKELRILYSSNADMFARAEQAEKELAAERGKVERLTRAIRLAEIALGKKLYIVAHKIMTASMKGGGEDEQRTI